MEQVENPQVRPRQPLLGKALRYAAIAVGVLIVLAAALWIWLSTQSGRDMVAAQISRLSFANGMSLHVDRIEGSLLGALTIRNLDIGDPDGRFFHAENVALDYRPLAYIGGHLDIRRLHIPAARLERAPRFKPTPPSNEPLLPDLDIDVGQLAVDRLEIAPAITGRRHIVSLQGQAHIADRRAQITTRAAALVAPGVAGGDRLALKLDAVPQINRLNMDFALDTPADGLLAALTGQAEARHLRLAGRGDWKAWNGSLAASAGGKPLADMVINARAGTIHVAGLAHPDVWLKGQNSALFQPETKVDATAAFDKRQMQVTARIGNANFALAVDGMADMGNNTMHQIRLALKVMQPRVLATNLSGNDIVAEATLDGSFAAPRIAYALKAASIGFGATRIDRLAASGSAALDKDHWRIPINGTARAITGVSASVAPLLDHVRFGGDFGYANGRLLSDNIRVQSSRIDARAVVIADLPRALYTGTLNGTVNGYRVESVGIFNLASNIGLKTQANGGFRLEGRVSARSTRLLNDGIAGFLGGNALISARVGYGSDGVATVDGLTIAAPAFRLADGRGSYDAKGQIAFAANASSDLYGPIRLSAKGSVAQPVLHLEAPRPGMGVGLAALVADVRGAGGAYQVKAKAASDYGPIGADLLISTAKGPLAVDLRPGTSLAGIALTGHVQQQAAGPFAGALALAGAGVNGRVDLSAMGAHQRAVAAITGQNVSLPGKAGLTIARLVVKGDAVMADRPQVNTDVQLAGARQGDFYLAQTRANITYRDGAGEVKLLTEGRNRYPFRVAAQGRLSPDLWLVAINGRINGVNVASRGAMEIVPEKAGYLLRPATLSVNNGSLRIEGRYGAASTLRARMEGVDLALVNGFVPDLGLGGRMSGSLDLDQAGAGAMPRVDAQLHIAGLTRTGLSAVSTPVDITMAAQLDNRGAHAQALVRRGDALIGQMQVNATPGAAETGTWSNRLMAAPLSGGVRYNGPADVLASLAALSDQSLKGPIGIAADFGGSAHAPSITGTVRAQNLVYDNATYGTRLSDMALQGRFTNDRLEVQSLTAKAGDGTVKASGFISLSAQEGYPIQLGINMANAQLASGADLSARASGDIKLVNAPGQQPTVSGTLDLPETHYRIVRQGSAAVPTLSGVRHKPAIGPERISGDAEPVHSLPVNWNLDMRVRADNQIFVTGMGLDSEWSSNLRIGGSTTNPAITGTVRAVRGTLDFAGHSFTIDSGTITLNGGDLTDPALNIRASGTISDVTISIVITGTGSNPEIALTSDPALPQDELMARILFGGPVGSLSTLQAVQLASSLNTLRGAKGGLNPLGALQSATAISRLRVLGADATTGRQTALAAGKYITNNIYVEVVTDTRGYMATQLEIALTKAFSVLSQAGQFGGTGVTARYRKRY